MQSLEIKNSKDNKMLIGVPFRENLVRRDEDKEEIWVADKLLVNFTALGYKPTGESRTNYAKPFWIRDHADHPIILTLDDEKRSSIMVLQSLMTLKAEGRFISWALPKGSTVICTNNPDDGDYIVTSVDNAMATRSLKFLMKPCVDSWALWATQQGIDERLINFMDKNRIELIEKEEFDKDGIPTPKGNLRLWTIYFNALGAYKTWGTGEKDDPIWRKMFLLGQNSLPVEHLIQLSKFIQDGFDKIPSVEEMLSMTEESAIAVLKKFIMPTGQKSSRRQDLCAVISRRFLNHVIVHHQKYDKKMENVLFKILEDDILSPDLMMLIMKKAQYHFPDITKNAKLVRKISGVAS